MPQAHDIILDGDYKGHPFRGNQHVTQGAHSSVAVRSSMSAKHAELKGDKKAQKKAHKSAYHAHAAAIEQATTKASRKYHKTMAKFHGSRAGMTLDSAEFDDTQVLDAAPDASLAVVGRIYLGGELKGRAVIVGDGKAMVYKGNVGTERVTFASKVDGEVRDAMWSDGDAARMVGWLLDPPAAGVKAGASAGDVSYAEKDDMFTSFMPESKAGEAAWAIINAAPESSGGVILTAHAQSLIAQLREAGYTVTKRKRATTTEAEADALMAELNAGGSPFDAFQESGKKTWQVTRAEWVALMVSEYSYLGTPADDSNKDDFRQHHRDQVKAALDAGEPVPAEVLADYPTMKAETAEEKDARIAESELRLKAAFGIKAPKRVTMKEAREAMDMLRYSVNDLQGHQNAEFLRADVLGRLEPKMSLIKALVKRGWPDGVGEPESLLGTAQAMIDRHARMREQGLTEDMGKGEAWGYLTHDKKLSPERVDAILANPTSVDKASGLMNVEIPRYTMAYLNSEADKKAALSGEDARRVQQSLDESRALLAREQSYSSDLQKPGRIGYYSAFIEYLQGLLDGSRKMGEGEPQSPSKEEWDKTNASIQAEEAANERFNVIDDLAEEQMREAARDGDDERAKSIFEKAKAIGDDALKAVTDALYKFNPPMYSRLFLVKGSSMGELMTAEEAARHIKEENQVSEPVQQNQGQTPDPFTGGGSRAWIVTNSRGYRAEIKADNMVGAIQSGINGVDYTLPASEWAAEEVIDPSAMEATIGGVKFLAIRRDKPAPHWTARVADTGEDLPQTYQTKPKLWEDLQRSARATGDRWASQFVKALAKSAAGGADKAYLQSMIAGTADLLDPGIAEKLEPMFAKYEQDAEMMGLLNQAAEAYGAAVEKAAMAALGR